MPAVALLIIWWKRGRIDWQKDFLPLLPLLVVGILAGMFTAYMEKVRVGVGMQPQDWIYAPTELGQIGAKCIIAGKVIWFYIAKLLYPRPLIFNYMRWAIDPEKLVQYIFPISVIVALAALALGRKRVGNAVVAAVLFYLLTLFPAMGFIDVWPMRYSFVADHFVYLSSIGLIALIAAIATKYLPRPALYGFGAIILSLFCVMTYNQSKIYTNLGTLWEDTINKTNQQSWFAMNNYGILIRDENTTLDPQDRLKVAEKWFNRVIKVKPDHPEARFNLARIAELRATLAKMAEANHQPTTRPGEYEQQAIKFFNDAIQINPKYIDAHYFLGRLLLSLGRENEAAAEFRTVIGLWPRHDLAHYELGMLAMKHGKTDDAIQELIRALEINPDWVEAHKQLGIAFLEKGDVTNGLQQWDEAMSLSPNDWRLPNEFGVRMAASGENNKAVDYLRKALAINPQAVEAITNLGVLAAKEGHLDQAKDNFEKALAIDPDFATAKKDLEDLKTGKLHSTTKPATTRSANSSK